MRTPYATPLNDTSNSVALTPFLSSFVATCLQTRDLKPQISRTSPQKVAYYRELMTPSYSSGNLLSPPRRLMATTAAGADSPLMASSAFMCHSWPDRGSCTEATPMTLATSVSHAHSKCWNASIRKQVWKPTLNGVYDAASSVRHKRPLVKLFAGLHSQSPCPQAPEYLSVLSILGC